MYKPFEQRKHKELPITADGVTRSLTDELPSSVDKVPYLSEFSVLAEKDD